MSRLDYVKYDERAQVMQAAFKAEFETVLARVEQIKDCRAKSLALTKIEEAYMWVGKAIRDDQVQRENAECLKADKCL